MRILLTADWHLTGRPEDEYRWKIFRDVSVAVQKHKCDEIFMLGDLTHFKDGHSAEFTNRLVTEMVGLHKLARITVLTGNHDYTDRRAPFFKFLENIYTPQSGNIHWINNPVYREPGGFLFLPHTRNYLEEWPQVRSWIEQARVIFLHQCMAGSIANGHQLEGVYTHYFAEVRNRTQIFAGDIHEHQNVGGVEYIGAPHPVAFGDSYPTRMLIWDEGKLEVVPVNTIKKIVARIRALDDLLQLDIAEGDQLKVIYEIDPNEVSQWPKIRDALVKGVTPDTGVTLSSVELKILERAVAKSAPAGRTEQRSPKQVVAKYAEDRQIDPRYVPTGIRIAEELA